MDRTKPTLPCPPPDAALTEALERLDAAQAELQAARAAVRAAMNTRAGADALRRQLMQEDLI